MKKTAKKRKTDELFILAAELLTPSGPLVFSTIVMAERHLKQPDD